MRGTHRNEGIGRMGIKVKLFDAIEEGPQIHATHLECVVKPESTDFTPDEARSWMNRFRQHS
jgi:hypothetical protein